MTSNTIKFIAADMDGTLLNEEGKLDPAFFELYETLDKNNIIFAAASGRQYQSLAKTFTPIKDRMMFIAENGTMVKHKGETLYTSSIDKAAITQIIKTVREIDGAEIVVSGIDGSYTEIQTVEYIDEFSKYYEKLDYVPDLLQLDEDFIKVAICHFDGSEKYVYPIVNERFGQTHKVVVSAKIWVDIMNNNASKGAAIKHLQKTLGFTYEETMSFGDYFNDIEMLKESYHSYAMKNAHPEIKKHARFSAPSNTENGVLRVIKTHLASHC